MADPDYSKMSEEELMAITGQIPSEYQKMSDSELRKISGTSGSDNSNVLDRAGMVGLGAIGVGGAYLAKKAIDPFLKAGSASRELRGIGSQFGFPKDIAPTDVLSLLNTQRITAEQGFKRSLQDFDKTMLSAGVEDLADTITRGQGDFLKNPPKKYGAALDVISEKMAKSGKEISNATFDSMLSKTADYLRSRGFGDDELAPILKSMQMTYDKSGVASVKNMTLTQAKGIVSKIVSENPTSPVASILLRNWGDFLESNAPAEVVSELKDLNKSYKSYAQAREALHKIKNPNTGQYDQKALYRYLQKYAKDSADKDTVALMELLGKGSGISEPIQGAEESFNRFRALKEKRSDMQKEILAKAEKISSARERATILASKLKDAERGITKVKGVGKGLAKASAALYGLGKLGGMFMSAYPQISGGLQFAQDPEAWMLQNEFGIDPANLAPKGSLERKIQLGQVT